MTAKIVLENLKHKPMRSLLSILLIGVPVTLILCLVGLSQGFLRESRNRASGVGFDILIAPKGSSFLSMSGITIPEAMVDFVSKRPHVKLATGVANAAVEAVTMGASGVDLEKFNQMSGGFTYLEGGPFKKDDEILVDRQYADQHKLHVGSQVKLFNHDWRVSGVIASGKLTRIAVPLKTMQSLLSADHKVTLIYVKLDDPANTNAVIADLKALLPDNPIKSMAEITSLYNVDNVPALSAFITVIMAIGVVIGFAVVCLSMYMAVLQRTREIGILKSLGSSNGFILGIILMEALMLGLGGTLVGIVFSVGACKLIAALVPASFPMIIVASWWPIAGGITIAGSVLGAVYPGLSAARHDPIEALSYE